MVLSDFMARRGWAPRGAAPAPTPSSPASAPARAPAAAARGRLHAPLPPAAGKRNSYVDLQRDLLPGGVPNTPTRRLSFRIRHSLGARQLAEMYRRARVTPALWEPKHGAGILMRLARVTYYRLVSGWVPDEVAAGEIRSLLEITAPDLGDAKVVRLIYGPSVAQLLVVISKCWPGAPASVIDPLVRELMRAGGRKLPAACASPQLLAELAAALAALRWRERPLWLGVAAAAKAHLPPPPPQRQQQQQQQQQQQPQQPQQPPPCDMQAQDLVRLAVALSEVNLVDHDLLDQIAAAVAPKAPLLGVSEIADLAAAFSRLGYRPGDDYGSSDDDYGGGGGDEGGAEGGAASEAGPEAGAAGVVKEGGGARRAGAPRLVGALASELEALLSDLAAGGSAAARGAAAWDAASLPAAAAAAAAAPAGFGGWGGEGVAAGPLALAAGLRFEPLPPRARAGGGGGRRDGDDLEVLGAAAACVRDLVALGLDARRARRVLDGVMAWSVAAGLRPPPRALLSLLRACAAAGFRRAPAMRRLARAAAAAPAGGWGPGGAAAAARAFGELRWWDAAALSALASAALSAGGPSRAGGRPGGAPAGGAAGAAALADAVWGCAAALQGAGGTRRLAGREGGARARGWQVALPPAVELLCESAAAAAKAGAGGGGGGGAAAGGALAPARQADLVWGLRRLGRGDLATRVLRAYVGSAPAAASAGTGGSDDRADSGGGGAGFVDGYVGEWEEDAEYEEYEEGEWEGTLHEGEADLPPAFD